MANATITRSEALRRLAHHGVTGNDVHLLDVIPLFEMAWADGEVHPAERTMILAFLEDHLARLDVAARSTVVTRLEALRFVNRFLDENPATGVLEELRGLLTVVCLTAPDGGQRAQRILDAAMAVGGAAPSPHHPQVPWDAGELQKMWDLEEALGRHLA